MQWNAMQCNAMQCNAIKGKEILKTQLNAINAIKCFKMQEMSQFSFVKSGSNSQEPSISHPLLKRIFE